MKQYIPLKECYYCYSENVIVKEVKGSNKWLHNVTCNNCGNKYQHNEGDKHGGGFDTITRLDMIHGKSRIEFEISAENMERFESDEHYANMTKGEIFQQSVLLMTEAMYPQLRKKFNPASGGTKFNLEWYGYTIDEMIELMNDLSEFPHKVADYLNMLKKQKEHRETEYQKHEDN